MESRWHVHQLRVRYQETDQMGVVYHANVFNWFEIGRTELIRSLGMPYDTLEEQGLLVPVLDAQAKFLLPARYDEIVQICTRVTDFSHVRLEFAYEIRRGADSRHGPANELLVTGATKHMWVNRSFKPVRIAKDYPELHQLITQAIGVRNSP